MKIKILFTSLLKFKHSSDENKGSDPQGGEHVLSHQGLKG